MNAHFTRSIAIALVLTFGAASAPAFAARIGNGGPTHSAPSSPSGPGPSTSGPGNGHGTELFADVQNCVGVLRCINVPPKHHIDPVVTIQVQSNCDMIRYHFDGSIYKDCRREWNY